MKAGTKMEEKKHILIVDDDESTRKSLSLIFKKKGYETHVFGTGKEALAAAKERFLNAALLDIRLPDILGIELIKPLKQIHPDIAIIMATGFASLDTAIRALNEGAAGYIAKPLDMDEVLAKVGDVLEKQHLVLENRRLQEEIRESELRYRTITENMTDTVWVMDMDFKNIFISLSVLKTRGYTLDELNALPLDKNFTPQSFEIVTRIMAEEMTPERLADKDITISRNVELEFCRKDGTTFWADIVMTLVRDAEGRPKEIIGVGRDISERKLAEEVLFTAKRDWEGTFNSINDMVTIHDADYNIIRYNTAAKRLLGLPNLVSSNVLKCYQYYHGRDCPPEGCPSCQCLQTQQEAVFEFFEPHLNAFVEVRAIPRFDSSDQLIGLVHVVKDITERKQAEEELRRFAATVTESERHLKALINNIPDIVWLKDAESRFVAVNEPFGRSCGFSPEELIGKSDIDIWPEDLARRYREDDLAVMRLGSTKIVEEPLADKQGKISWIETIKTPIYDERGEVAGTVGIARDLTERKRAEEELRVSEEKFRNLFETSPDCIYITALDGRITEVNNAVMKLSGYSPEEFKKLNIVDFYADPEDREKFVKEVLKEGFIDSREMKLKKKDGTLNDTLVTVISVKDKDGKAVGFQGVVRDITEKKRMEMQLLQSEKLSAVGTMISGVAHELNNPLTSIIGNAQLLAKRNIPDEIKSKLDVIIKESIRSSKIVGGLLAFAREHKPERRMININNTLMESFKLREYDLKVSNIAVQTLLSEDLPETSADTYQLHQVFINIINNARDALSGQDRGALVIRTYRKDDAILIEFEDNGPGIAEELVRKIFDPFFTTKEVGKGTGLGLSMAYGIIKEHRGTILVESKTGKGAKFTVILPIVEDREVILEDFKAPVKVPNGVRTVLVVEDEASLRDLLAEALTEEGGFFVETASTGEEAIHLIGKRKFNAVVSDIKMPGIGGKELYLYIQKHHPEMADKFVFLTGDVLSKDTLSFLQITGNRYIEKPFDVDALVALLNDVLSK